MNPWFWVLIGWVSFGMIITAAAIYWFNFRASPKLAMVPLFIVVSFFWPILLVAIILSFLVIQKERA